MDLHSLATYQYDLPENLIAQQPAESRDASRLMLVDRHSGNISEIPFREIVDLLDQGDSLIFNDTKVIPARLYGQKESGGKAEIFLLEQKENGKWEALARPARKLKLDSKIFFSDTFYCKVLEKHEEGIVRIEFNDPHLFEHNLKKYGKIPLPHYIKREGNKAQDEERYQTVFAQTPGAVAAPTAGLHFTKELLNALAGKGVAQDYVTLHVGLGTFKPVMVSDIREHPMHSERLFISEETAKNLNSCSKNKRQICVGTTCCRTLESAANDEGIIFPGQKATNIFIYPGYQFKYVRCLLTNFHLPCSTLLMLVSAFAGYELIMEAYKKAVKDHFRFYSYGDAMLIL